MIYEKLQKKWSFWFKIGINYEVSYLEHRLLLPPIAQLVEHQTSDQEVMSSSLTWGSILFYARLCTVISHCALWYCASELLKLWTEPTKFGKFFRKLLKLSFWVRIVVILSVAQLVRTFIFFSAWDKSRVKWDNSQNSRQKIRT